MVKYRKKLSKDSFQGQRLDVGLRDWRNTSRVNEKGRKTNTNYVDSDAESEQKSTPNYVFSVGDRLGQRSGIVTVVVGAVHFPNVLIDSGATCNLLGQGTWEWLKLQKIECQTLKETKALFPYGNTKPLPILGTFRADIMFIDTGATCKTDFVFVNTHGKRLFCRETAEKFDLIRLGPSHIVTSVNTESDIKEKYKECFNVFGPLKDYELKLNINDLVKRLPNPSAGSHLVYERKSRKLDELLETGIIEEVPERPTGWVSPLVVIHGQVRQRCQDLCGHGACQSSNSERTSAHPYFRGGVSKPHW